MTKNIDSLLSNNKKLYTIKELKSLDLSYYIINKLVKQNKLQKLSYNVYENTNYKGQESDFYYVTAFVPFGIICLMSAAVYYNLTTYIPNEINVAIERSHKVSTLPEWPPINIIYFSQKRFEIGIIKKKEAENEFKIYDIEKTVIDIIFYRNKIGIEQTKEILLNYLSLPQRNLNKLHQYAKLLNCEKILNTYMEVLIWNLQLQLKKSLKILP